MNFARLTPIFLSDAPASLALMIVSDSRAHRNWRFLTFDSSPIASLGQSGQQGGPGGSGQTGGSGQFGHPGQSYQSGQSCQSDHSSMILQFAFKGGGSL